MNESHQDPRIYLKALWRWKLLFLLFLIGLPVGAYAYVKSVIPTYQSQALIQEDPVRVDTSLFLASGSQQGGVAASPQVLGGEARVIQTPTVASLANVWLHPREARANALLSEIKATPSTATGYITITATSPDPKRASAVANSFAHAVVRMRGDQADSQLTQTINNLSTQLSILTHQIQVSQTRKHGAAVPSALETQQTQLSANLQEVRAIKAAQVSNASVVEYAEPSLAPVSPNKTKTVGLGLIAGLLLGLGAVFLAEAADRRIRHPEDLEEMLGLPLLSVLHRSAFTPRAIRADDNEAFQMLRSSLQFFNVDREISSILIASPSRGDGKTTVASGLALAAAQTGLDVILVDADLRRPCVAERFGIDKSVLGGGLGAVLSGQSKLLKETIDVQIHDPDEEFGPVRPRGRLRIIAGPGPVPNPGELLASHRMRVALNELTEIAQLVVIDTPPLLGISDAWPLVEAVSGVLMVVQFGQTSKTMVRRLKKMLDNAHATLLGAVATGATRGTIGDYGYGYRYYYSYANRRGDSRRGRLSLARLARSGVSSENGASMQAARNGSTAHVEEAVPADGVTTAVLEVEEVEEVEEDAPAEFGKPEHEAAELETAEPEAAELETAEPEASEPDVPSS